MAKLTTINETNIEDIQIFVDKTRDFSTSEFDQNSISGEELARALPQYQHRQDNDVALSLKTEISIEAMLVIPDRLSSQLFERELISAGLRTTAISNPFQSFEMAVRTKPDIIVASAVMQGINGANLLASLAAMPETNNISLCLLTTFERGHNELKGLPDKAKLVHKSSFKEDLLSALKDSDLI